MYFTFINIKKVAISIVDWLRIYGSISFGVILLIFLTTSCSIKGYNSVSNSSKSTIDTIFVFSGGFNKVLYQTEINIYNRTLTGITIIKNTGSSTRVVSMSEMGLKYFDIEFPKIQDGDPIIHYVMEPLNKKLLVNMFIKDFGLLFYMPEISNSDLLYSNNQDTEGVAIINNGLVYYTGLGGRVSSIDKKRILLPTKPIVSIVGFSNNSPDKISITHSNIFLSFVKIKNI